MPEQRWVDSNDVIARLQLGQRLTIVGVDGQVFTFHDLRLALATLDAIRSAQAGDPNALKDHAAEIRAIVLDHDRRNRSDA